MLVRARFSLAIAALAGCAVGTSQAQSLATIFGSNNNGSPGGIIYFDANVTSGIIVNRLDINTITTGPIGITVYTKSGTYVGSEQNPAAWTLASTGSGTGIGQNLPSEMVLDSPITLNSGVTAIAIVGSAPGFPAISHYYTNGTGTNQFFSNADLSLTLGAAQNAPFSGAPFTPRVWNGVVHYTPANPNVTGACCFPDGTCDFITLGACQAAGGAFRGENVQCAAANCPQPGACCLNDGTCTFVLQSACNTAGGTWTSAGTTCASANCPQPAACCLVSGGCLTLTPAPCAAAGGAYMGSGSQCGTVTCPQPFNEIGNAGDLPSTANVVEGSGPLLRINGTIVGSDDVDMFKIQICDYQNFSATTVGTTTFDTIMSLFNEGGFGVSYNDDAPAGTLQSRLTGQFVPGNGIYYVAVSQYSRHPASTGGRIWQATPFNVERMPDGPGAAGAITGWLELGGAGGAYGINLTGACYISSTSCYPNCDGSTVEPILNIDDFTCFINEFAVGQTLPPAQQVTSYANCDGSTIAPVLNIDDFTCFINSFAQGCP